MTGVSAATTDTLVGYVGEGDSNDDGALAMVRY